MRKHQISQCTKKIISHSAKAEYFTKILCKWFFWKAIRFVAYGTDHIQGLDIKRKKQLDYFNSKGIINFEVLGGR